MKPMFEKPKAKMLCPTKSGTLGNGTPKERNPINSQTTKTLKRLQTYTPKSR